MTRFLLLTWWGSDTDWLATLPPWDIGDTQWEGRESCRPCPACCCCIMALALFCRCCWRRGVTAKLARRLPDWMEGQGEEGKTGGRGMFKTSLCDTHSRNTHRHLVAWRRRDRWMGWPVVFLHNSSDPSISCVVPCKCLRFVFQSHYHYPHFFTTINMTGWSDQIVHAYTHKYTHKYLPNDHI